MNCKPGDMALVVRALPESDPMDAAIAKALLGKVVEVVRVDADGIWDIAEKIQLVNVSADYGWAERIATVSITAVPDEVLLPIRNNPDTVQVLDEVTA